MEDLIEVRRYHHSIVGFVLKACTNMYSRFREHYDYWNFTSGQQQEGDMILPIQTHLSLEGFAEIAQLLR